MIKVNFKANLRSWHHFFLEHGVYPVFFSALLIVPLYAYPLYRAGYLVHRPLLWNFFLATIPYPCALLAAYLHGRFPKRWLYLIIPSTIWLAFLPNAPYLVTDVVHFRTYFFRSLWHEVISMVALVWTGLFIAIYSIRTMQYIIKDYTNTVLSWVFVIIILLLNGLGVYLGRFLRWNSWDLITNPDRILDDATVLFNGSRGSLVSLLFVIQMAIFMLICYLTITITYPQKRV
ncbi:MAG: DUF1361 domain-containing protein [Chloroflexota bacterium]